mmetsp:Transcript_37048/g.58292  ORF Transcript_37048/g.58292 Transcript_37048/m.58292 type:complete len:810 (-) Transcript_37048:107-2536(-)
MSDRLRKGSKAKEVRPSSPKSKKRSKSPKKSRGKEDELSLGAPASAPAVDQWALFDAMFQKQPPKEDEKPHGDAEDPSKEEGSEGAEGQNSKKEEESVEEPDTQKEEVVECSQSEERVLQEDPQEEDDDDDVYDEGEDEDLPPLHKKDTFSDIPPPLALPPAKQEGKTEENEENDMKDSSTGGSKTPTPSNKTSKNTTLQQANESNSSWSKSSSNIAAPASQSPAGFHRTPSFSFGVPTDGDKPAAVVEQGGTKGRAQSARPASSLNERDSSPHPSPRASARVGSSSPRKSRPRPSKFSPKSKPREEKMMDEEGVLKSGWLMKRGGKKWNKRWFIVRMGSVSYYDDPSSSLKTPRFSLPLKRGTCRVVLRGSATETKTFGLIWSGEKGPDSGGSFDLQAKQIGEVVEWMAVLESAFVEDEEGSFCSLTSISVGSAKKKEKKEVVKELGKYEGMVELLTRDENELLRRAVEESVSKKDEKRLAGEMVHVYEMKGKTIEYLEELIGTSIESCVRPNTLFRGNGVTEKALTSYCYLVGSDYLKKALKPLFLSVLNSSCSYEVDPAKIQKKEDLQGNIVNLLSVSEMFMAKITLSKFTNVPYSIRVVCRKLAVATNTKFPDGLYSILGGLFFLRFVCPALTLPTEMGIWPSELPQNAKRALLLISKILMALSNGVRFGKKEEYMIPMNEFIDKNDSNLRVFFDKLILDPSKQDQDQREEEEELKQAEIERWNGAQPNFETLGSLAKHLDSSSKKIGSNMEARAKKKAKEEKGKSKGKKGEKEEAGDVVPGEAGPSISALVADLKKNVAAATAK